MRIPGSGKISFFAAKNEAQRMTGRRRIGGECESSRYFESGLIRWRAVIGCNTLFVVTEPAAETGRRYPSSPAGTP